MGVMQVVAEQRWLARCVMREWAKGERLKRQTDGEHIGELREKINASYGTKGLSYDKPSVLSGTISDPTAEAAAKIDKLKHEWEQAVNNQLDSDTRLLTIYNATEVFLRQLPDKMGCFLRDCYRLQEGRKITYAPAQLSEMYGCSRQTVYRWETEAIDRLRMLPGFERLTTLVEDEDEP